MTDSSMPKRSLWPVYIAIALVLGVALVFLIEFVVSTQSEIEVMRDAEAAIASGAYETEVAVLLEGADPAAGEALLTQYGCIACHQSSSGIAPEFAGLADRAGTRRPPLSAAAYLYESITSPIAFVVSGYNPSMPQNYPERLGEQELGNIIAYLLTLKAE
jgi:mono/diheme cytochrome c family protein